MFPILDLAFNSDKNIPIIMAKPDNSGRIIMSTLIGALILWIVNRMLTGMASYFNANVYVLYAFVIVQVAQLVILTERASKRFRRIRKGVIIYKIDRPPIIQSSVISGVMAIPLFSYLFYTNTESFVRQMAFLFTGILCLAPTIFSWLRLARYGNYSIRITNEDILYQYGKKERKFSFREMVFVDYITQIKDIRDGYVKIGLTVKLVDGREWEINTWDWGFTQEQVSQLASDINDHIIARKE